MEETSTLDDLRNLIKAGSDFYLRVLTGQELYASTSNINRLQTYILNGMKNIKKRKYPKDGFPGLKLGIEKWEIGMILLSFLLILFLIYLILEL